MAKKATTLHDNLGNELLPVTNASITLMDNGNSVQAEINDLKEKTRYNKGHFSTPEALNLAYPSTNPDGSIISDEDSKLRAGWYAIVGSTDTVWIWDVEGKEWVDSSYTISAVESVNGLDGEVILTGGNINATATINDTSKTELINVHLTDIYSEFNNKVNNDEFSQEIQNIKDIIPTKVSELTNDSNYATEQYVEENGGKIDTISVNGTQQEIINKNVNISVPTKTSELENDSDFTTNSLLLEVENKIPTDNNQLSNGAGYQTANDVNTLISNATQNMLTTSNYQSTLDSVYQKVGDYATITDLETKQDQLTSTQLQAVNSGANTTNINQITTNSNNINTINSKIPNQASSTNQLADKEFVNSSINSISAFYITSNSNGDPFPTKSALINATTYYSGGEVRTPTRNDYATVLQDESEGNATTRYIYYNQWEYQYTVNETPLTAEQLSAINSGITSELVGKISSNEANINSISNELSTNYAKKSELNNYLPKTGGTLTAISGDTALNVQSKSNTSYIGFKDSNGSLLGYYGVNASKKPVFYNGGDKVLAYASDIPDVSGFAKTTDLANYVPTSRTVNGKALSSNISLGSKDVGALPDYTLTISHQSSGNPRMVKFARVNYSSKATCFKMGAMTCHDNGVSYQFLTDMLISVTTAGAVTANIYKFAQSSIGNVDGVARYTGDVFYVNDTTNKIVDFYILCGQYSASQFTPVTKVGSTTITNVTQYSGNATYYSSGTKEWANGCGTTYARLSDIPDTSSFVTTDTEQTITGAKTFNKEAYFNGDRMTITSGNPVPFQYNSGKRGLMIYSDGIAIASNTSNGNNDSAWIRHIEDTVNEGSLEIAVGDDNDNEYIKFRGYNTNSQVAWEAVVPRKSGTIALTSDLGTQATYSLSGTTLTITPK